MSLSQTFSSLFVYISMMIVCWFRLLLFFYWGLLLLLHVSNKRTLRQGVSYDRLRSYYMLLSCLKYDSQSVRVN